MNSSYEGGSVSGKRRRRRKRSSVLALFAAFATLSSTSSSAASPFSGPLGPLSALPPLPSVVPNLMARSGAAVKSATDGARSVVGRGLAARGGGGGARLASTKKRRRSNNSGFYYGIREDVMLRPSSPRKAAAEEEGGKGSNGNGNAEASSGDSSMASPGPTAPGPGASGPGGPGGGPGQRLVASRNSRAALSDVMGETLLELREMREDIAALREEMRVMKRRMRTAVLDEYDEEGEEYHEEGGGEIPGSDRRRLLAQGEGEEEYAPHHHEHGHGGLGAALARRKKAREFDRIGTAVERWAERLLFDEGGEEDGWKEVACNKMVRNKFNGGGTTTCFLKWIKDSRGGDPGVTGVARGGGNGGDSSDDEETEYPCVKLYGTIDAPMEDVCAYLSDESRLGEYNDLVVANRDLEEISPHSKITWGQTPQILFIKPRDFVTFCHHRWKKDGTQVVINQAVEHEDAPGHHTESNKDDGKVCRAYALRGANFIGRDPSDPNGKTRLAILAHCDPGGGIPRWATKTAVNAVAPIEPFKLLHKIESGVKSAMAEREGGSLASKSKQVSTSSALAGDMTDERAVGSNRMPAGRSSKPAGLSQLGYACFWPEGGGIKEGFLAHEHRHAHGDDMYPHEGPPPHHAHAHTQTQAQAHAHSQAQMQAPAQPAPHSSHGHRAAEEGGGYYEQHPR